MKYYNPLEKRTVYEDELVAAGCDISNIQSLLNLHWYKLIENNDLIYDKYKFTLVKSGNPVFQEDDLIYVQEYTLVPITSEERSSSLQAMKIKLRKYVDTYTLEKIEAGFDRDMPIKGVYQSVHFSYDEIDQYNFSDAANLSLISLLVNINMDNVEWNGYINYTPATKGQLVVLKLSAIELLTLYACGLKHKKYYDDLNMSLHIEIDESVSIDDLNTRMKQYNIPIEL